MKILHLVHSAPPDVSGASVRTRYLAETQLRLGLSPVVLSSPFQEPIDPANTRGREWVGLVPYYRCFDGGDGHAFMTVRKPLRKRARKLLRLPAFVRRAREIAHAARVDVVHGHGLFYCGLAAAMTARSLGVPSVYEVRSLTEDGLVAQGGFGPRSLGYRGYRAFDALALRLVTHVTTISEGLRTDLVARGCDPRRITVVGNGVDADRQRPAGPKSAELMARFGYGIDTFVVGYVGTLLAYEGLDLLVEAAARLAPKIPALAVLIVGDGDAAPALRALVRERGLERTVRFVGPVPHEAVGDYYGLIDLFVLPRRRSRLTDLVTPLKPLEIMARARPVLASDCGGHLELVQNGVNGYTFRADDQADFEAGLRSAVERRLELPEAGQRAREWVLRQRSWETMVRPCVDLYAALTRRAAPTPAQGATSGERAA